MLLSDPAIFSRTNSGVWLPSEGAAVGNDGAMGASLKVFPSPDPAGLAAYRLGDHTQDPATAEWALLSGKNYKI